MPIVSRVAELHPEIVAWRRDFHSNPELGFDVDRTWAIVAERLREFGCDQVVTGIGKTGVVGVIKGRATVTNGNPKTIGLRADMDALEIDEKTNLPYSSKNKGLMHACGHDGHTAMLLGAAKYLAETRNFAGTVVCIFQPAEEIGTGAKAMVGDQLMERFGIEEVYGMHCLPGLPVGFIGIHRGGVMAATDSIDIKIHGRSGHPGLAHLAIDSILVSAQLLMAIQQITSQNVSAMEAANITFHNIQAGGINRVITETVHLQGAVRTLSTDVHDMIKARLQEVVSGVALATGAKIELKFEHDHGVLFNTAAQTEIAEKTAAEIVGKEKVYPTPPTLLGEDFAIMSDARPGTFVFCGNGDSAGLHHPAFDFNDEASLYGTSYWVKLVENRLAA
ncbi:amidohydrolase [Ensifer aridi]|uniref:amidohydrolase n=1 Tax=Ensifer aridi TaxID=1708715 RepID=UPI00358EBEC6